MDERRRRLPPVPVVPFAAAAPVTGASSSTPSTPRVVFSDEATAREGEAEAVGINCIFTSFFVTRPSIGAEEDSAAMVAAKKGSDAADAEVRVVRMYEGEG